MSDKLGIRINRINKQEPRAEADPNGTAAAHFLI